MSNASISSKIEVLAQIWGRLLQISNVGPDDNFFDLGGDSALAIQLFAEIGDTFGQLLPPVMIYHVPTVALLAALLEQPSALKLSPLILLKDGSHTSPLFLTSGLGGGPAEFSQLVKFVNSPHPIYGLQPKGIEGFDEPCDRIEEMADFYLHAVCHLQPRGPYLLAGYSLGGLVSLEMARSLHASGEKVALLLMLDSYPDISALPPSKRLRLLTQRTKRRVRNFGRAPKPEIRLGGLPDRDAISTFAPAFDRVRDAAYLALRRYRPIPYPGSVKFVRAADVTEFPADPAAIWSNLVDDIEVHTIPGDHLGMLTTHYEKLASVLNGLLGTAGSQASPDLT